MSEVIATDQTSYDWPELINSLNRLLRIRTTPIGMKLFATREEMEAVPRIRRPADIHTTDQIVGMACRNGWTVGITVEDLVGAQCSTVIGLSERSKEWLSGDRMQGVWYENATDAADHQAAMDVVPYGKYEAMVVSPLTSGRLNPPDICLIYMTPGQMITFINGLQYKNFKKYQFTCVGESACADSWGNALASGEPSVSIPCYAERKFGGVQDDEMLVALPPSFLPSVVAGLAALSRNGLRYPIPNHGLQKSPLDSISKSYG